MKNSSNNIKWVNTGRALSMIGIYIAHCNFYYLYLNSPAMLFSNLFRVSFFYFISGFLFFRSLEIYSIKHKFSKIANKLIWPALLFPAIIWIPKAVAHGNDLTIFTFSKDILGGTATWFISSIIVGQLLLLCLKSYIKNIYIILAITFGCFLLSFYLAKIDPTPFPWYYKSGLIASFFLTLGGVFYKNYNKLKTFLSYKALIISGILTIFMHFYTSQKGVYNNIMEVKFENIPLGLFNNILGIFFMLQLCHYLPSVKWLNYMGKNSILFYFFAGGIPLVVGYLTKCYIPFEGYVMTFFVIAISIAIMFPITYIINRYFAWSLDFSKISNKILKQKRDL
ncbi:MAG: acyltransferase family protein [Bacteroidales bacterium]|nr:acyltransferase family protein [Bacteroidales bacterium]